VSKNSSQEFVITDAELVLMQLLWRESPLTAREITERLEPETHWHRKTVNTLLSRLEKKGALAAEKQHGVNCFFPQIDQQSYEQSATSSFVDRLFGGNIAPLLASFAGKRPLDPDQVAELKGLLEELSDDD